MSLRAPHDRIVDLRALREADRSRFDRIWEGFRPIYAAGFPDPSEREDETTWLAWLDQDDPPPQPLFDVSVALAPGSEHVLGGAGYEYYRGSRAGLLAYLVVRPDSRRQGVGRALVAHALATLRDMARLSGAQRPALYTEAQDPAKVAPDLRSEAAQRLEMFARLGARRLDLPYTQPALAKGNAPARHMTLLTFGLPPEAQELPAAPVLAFMHELCRALEIADPDQDRDFRRARDAAGAAIRLLHPERRAVGVE